MNLEQNAKQLMKEWKWVKISFVAKFYRGISYTKDVASTTPSKNNVPILRAGNIDEELNYEDLVYVPKGLIKPEQFIKKDDILFAMSSGSKHLVGKSAVAKFDFEGSYGAFCGMLRVNEDVNKQYVAYVFKSNSYRKLISEIAKGTNINNLKREHILNFEFPLPAKHTQQAIVSKIEELFSELDKGIEQLKTAQKQLKTYRQAVLKWAFEGKLTKENVKKGELPEGWKVMVLQDLAHFITDGDHQAPPKSKKGIPFITISNINKANSQIDFSDTFLVPNEYYRNLKENRKPQKGDILYTVTGSFGIPILIDFGKEFCFQRHIGLIRPLETINQKWLYYLLQSNEVYNQAKAAATGTAQKTVALSSLRNFRILTPPSEEQLKIVDAIETRLSIAQKMEEAIRQSLQQAEALRQAILKKAFEGKLVTYNATEAIGKVSKVIPHERKILAGKIIQ
jgi:type I restriction enzyme S subunit